MSKVLVTGASGFIGWHLTERLQQAGFAVRALVRSSVQSREWPDAIEIIEGDVRDAGAMKEATTGCGIVFHLAGQADNLSELTDGDADYFAVNVEGTRHVLDGAVAAGASQFVYFSSVKAIEPTTAYGWSKLSAEQLVLDSANRAGLHAVCLRLPLVYGPGNKGNLFRMISAIDHGFFPPLPFVQNRRSLVSVINVVEAALLAATKPTANGQTYIVTDAHPYSTRELYEMICRGLGKRVPRWSVPLGLLKAVGVIGDAIGLVLGRRFFFDSDALGKLTGSACYSSDRIVHELEYRPSLTFQEALPELIAWYRKSL